MCVCVGVPGCLRSRVRLKYRSVSSSLFLPLFILWEQPILPVQEHLSTRRKTKLFSGDISFVLKWSKLKSWRHNKPVSYFSGCPCRTNFYDILSDFMLSKRPSAFITDLCHVIPFLTDIVLVYFCFVCCINIHLIFIVWSLLPPFCRSQ